MYTRERRRRRSTCTYVASIKRTNTARSSIALVKSVRASRERDSGCGYGSHYRECVGTSTTLMTTTATATAMSSKDHFKFKQTRVAAAAAAMRTCYRQIGARDLLLFSAHCRHFHIHWRAHAHGLCYAMLLDVVATRDSRYEYRTDSTNACSHIHTSTHAYTDACCVHRGLYR